MDIFEMLKEAGVEILADKKDDFNKEFRKTYKSEGEISKATQKLEADRDNWKQKAEDAEETLKKFDGIDPEKVQAELADWKRKAEDAEKDYAEKLAQRDFEDALKEEISGYKFTSEAAKRAVISDIREAGLKVKDGKILGLSDLISQMKEKDASAFVDEHQEALEQNRARFTQPLNQNAGGGKRMTRDEILGIKDRTERQRAIAENISLFQ